jgi:3-oxoacyl-[acyl-carrier protein] reductase
MDLNLSGKRAVICGGSQGIGLASAVELAKLGASCVLLSRDAAKLAAAAATLPPPEGANAGGKGQKHSFVVADLGDAASVKAAAATVLADGPVHILINNTGGPPAGSALDATPDQLAAAFTAHVISAQILVQAFAPGMKAAAFGRIINITSTSVKQPIAGLGISNIVRAAVANWAKSLSQELGGFGITVNNILPGYTATERLASLVQHRAGARGVPPTEIEREWIATIPAGRLGKPEEIAAAVAFLASPAAAFINGVNLPVDGGRLGTL